MGASPETEDEVGVGATSDGATGPDADPWALDPPRQPSPPVDEADSDREPVWHTTRDGWLSAESIGTHLRDRFASEDLESDRWSRTRRIVVALATFSGSAAVVAAVSAL